MIFILLSFPLDKKQNCTYTLSINLQYFMFIRLTTTTTTTQLCWDSRVFA